MLTVIRILDEGRGDKQMLECRCDCGNVKTMPRRNFRAAESCGCLHNIAMQKRVIDMTGKQFGRLTVLGRAGTNSQGNALWECLCSCGGKTVARSTDLRRGDYVSCGCYTKRYHADRLGRVAKTRVGVLNHKYDPTITDEERYSKRKAYYRLMETCRRGVFVRDGFTCQACGCGRSGSLVHHHIKPWKLFPNHRFFKRNCVTLCTKCHKQFHYRYGYAVDNSMYLVPWIRERRKEAGFGKL